MLWLTQRRLKSSNAASRRIAAKRLCEKPPRRALGALRHALADTDAEVRELAVTALGRLEDERRLEPLLGALRDSEPEVVKAAIAALKHIPGDKVTFALTGLLRHLDAGVRGHAAQALESQAWRSGNREDEMWFLAAMGRFARLAGFGAAAIPALELAVSTGSSGLGAGAVEALGEIGEPRVLRPLSHALKSDDPAMCVAAVGALQRLGSPSVPELLAGALRHKNPHVRAAAAEALGKLRAAGSLEHLQRLLADPVWEVRREAAEALGRLRDPRSASALAPALNDQDADVRETTAIALSNVGDRSSIRPLVLALKDPTSGVRRIAAAALSRIDPDWSSSAEAREAIAELKAGLQDGDDNVRYFVGQLLVSLGAIGPEMSPAADPDTSLVSAPSKRRKLAVTLFATVLCDADRVLRQAAAEALGHLGDIRARTALQRARSDPESGVREAAGLALELLAGSPG